MEIDRSDTTRDLSVHWHCDTGSDGVEVRTSKMKRPWRSELRRCKSKRDASSRGEIADSKLGPTGTVSAMKRGDVARNLNFQVVPYAPIKLGSAYCKLRGSAEAPGHERAGFPGAGAHG